ncbi:hypothetical protein JD844_019737 [Phrynosoma platyrhinos]|uniref:Telomere length regulation protein TEL2 homolog n=1 Tax=Phrynosoma platyrhinos TaxID=52577 RepID=A0ABQ7TPZ8_PHRPL|nr:hypothetical protein JD844_019737 [Phrynosoma platyrhinos]
MDSDVFHVRHTVQEAIDILSSSKDGNQISETLWTVKHYLCRTENPPSLKVTEEFTRSHFTTFLQGLINNLNPDWLELFQASFRLNKVADVLEKFLQRGGLSALMWEVCKQQTQVGTPVLQEAILNRIICLPDHLSNKFQGENQTIFFPQNYFPLLGMEIVQVLERIFDSLRDGLDCSISFVSQVLGKGCAHGRRKEILNVLVPHLTDRTQSDCIWQRMCWRLVESVPDRWMEAVVCGFVQLAPGSAVLTRLLGNLVLKSKKAEFVMTQKLLLFQYSYPTVVLQTLLGYLALESMRRPLLIKVFKELLETWVSSSAIRHCPVEQQLYISKAILICLSHLKEEEIINNRQELLTSLMEGMKCHLDSNLPRIRFMGMVVAECLSEKITPDGPVLKFQYEEDDEIRELKSLLTERPEETSVNDSPSTSCKEKNGDSFICFIVSKKDGLDDDLVPYDMSHDKELKKIKAPTYIRDCIAILTGPEDADKYEATMNVLEALIRKNKAAVGEISVELTKVLLHLEEKSYIEDFLGLRQRAMVAIVVIDPIPVARYLTSEFYSLNYSLRQRMDILDQLLGPKGAGIQIQSSSSSSSDWQKVVDERIKSKTRRFAKGKCQVEPLCAPNRFGPVVGHFFFPLLQNFDRPLNTFDLLGDDHLVLGRLAHTLAILMYFAVNTVVASAMGKALLEFVWVLRFHTDTYVRQGLLSCVSSLLLSVPAERLLEDMTEELLEAQFWLADVAEKDSDGDCRSLAVQNLLLMENLKKKLEIPPR